MKFFANTCQSRGIKYNGGGGGCLQQRLWKFNNIMNIINIMNMLLKSLDLAAIGKIITCMGKKEDPILHGPRMGGGGSAPQLGVWREASLARRAVRAFDTQKTPLE